MGQPIRGQGSCCIKRPPNQAKSTIVIIQSHNIIDCLIYCKNKARKLTKVVCQIQENFKNAKETVFKCLVRFFLGLLWRNTMVERVQTQLQQPRTTFWTDNKTFCTTKNLVTSGSNILSYSFKTNLKTCSSLSKDIF